MVEAALIPGLIGAMEAAGAGTAAKGTLDMMNSGKGKTRVLGEEKLDWPTKEPFDSEKLRNAADFMKIPLPTAVKAGLLVTLAMGGLSSREVKNIERKGYIPYEVIQKLDADTLNDMADMLGLEKVPEKLRKKVANMTNEDIEDSVNGGGDDGDDGDDEKAKKAAKRAAQTESLKKARERFRKFFEKANEHLENKDRPVRESQKNMEKWGKTFKDDKIDPKAMSKRQGELKKWEPAEQVPRDSERLKNLTGDERRIMDERLRNKALKDGTVENWDYNNIQPIHNIIKN